MSSENKKSIWSVIILVATIVSLVLLVSYFAVTLVGLPAITEAAKQAAKETGETDPAAIDLIAGIAVGAVIAALVVGSIFDVFKIIGGFLFSLKGRWGIFCIIVSIIALVTGVWGLVSDISNKAGALSIVLSVLSVLVDGLLVVACFKHKAELQ